MLRSLPLLTASALLILAGCAGKNELDETGGLRITRSLCPAVAVPAYTGDISLFDPAESRESRALDVSASVTNLRSTCDETSSPVRITATFDVVARRSAAAGPRDIVLPYFATVMRGGSNIVSKQVGAVQVHFDAGQLTGRGAGSASADVDRAAASLPDAISTQLNRKRKATDNDASIDPTTDPKVRTAMTRASFELLIGFQLSQSQLAYNATR